MYWENYGQYVLGSFDGIGFNQNANYSFIIYRKNYRGLAKNAICGANPAVLRYLADEAIGIKGSELVLSLLNFNNELPLTYFYSEEDDTYKITFTVTYKIPDPDNPFTLISQTKTWFEGYLVQEDSNEILSDIGHEVQLSFTDNLGSLRSIDFLTASKYSPTSAANLRTSFANMSLVAETATASAYVGFYSNTTFGSPQVGDFIVLNDSPVGDVSYKIIKIETVLGVKRFYISEKVNGFPLTSNVKFSFITGSDVYTRIKLADCLRICLQATNLNLNVKYAGNIIAYQEATSYTDIFNNVYIDGRTFMSDQNNWQSCYDVLNKICSRFNIGIFQQDGIWYMVRFQELRYYANNITGRTYNGYFASQSTGQITSGNAFGNETDIEQGITQTLIRPYNYYAENLKYKNPDNLLYNADLQILGAKLNQYTAVIDGVNHTVKEYEAPGFNVFAARVGQYTGFIRIWTNDITGNEYDRVFVVQEIGSQPDRVDTLYADKIEMNDGDSVKISFSYRTQNSYSPNNVKFGFSNAIDTVLNNTYFISNIQSTSEKNIFIPYTLIGTIPYDYYTDGLNGANLNEWRDIEINSYSTRKGAFYFGFAFADGISANGETWYKNLRVEVIASTGGQTTIDGHEHKTLVNKITKNNKDLEIYLDDTTKNSVAGTLFFNSFDSLVQNQTLKWADGQSVGLIKLGEITTREQMAWKVVPRTKLEGKILGIFRANYLYYAMYNGINFQVNNGTYYIFGKAEFNFREDTIDFTMYEIYKTGEYLSNGVFNNTLLEYNFKYLYK